MKFSKMDTKNPQKLDDNLIHVEYRKSIDKSLPGTDFVSVLIAHCHATQLYHYEHCRKALFYGQT
jgi:hypothetical protein